MAAPNWLTTPGAGHRDPARCGATSGATRLRAMDGPQIRRPPFEHHSGFVRRSNKLRGRFEGNPGLLQSRRLTTGRHRSSPAAGIRIGRGQPNSAESPGERITEGRFGLRNVDRLAIHIPLGTRFNIMQCIYLTIQIRVHIRFADGNSLTVADDSAKV